MREFFRPFRRKLGMLMLVVTCGFSAEWVRGFLYFDHLSLFDSEGPKYALWLGDNTLRCEWRHSEFNGNPSFHWGVYSPAPLMARPGPIIDTHGLPAAWPPPRPVLTWFWRWCGFGLGKRVEARFSKFTAQETTLLLLPPADVKTSTLIDIPYWSIVLPLTLLSAWLLLGTPRKRLIARV